MLIINPLPHYRENSILQ